MYYSSGPNLGQTPGGPPAFTDLTGIKSILGGNVNSLKALPVFTSKADLHLSQTSDNSAIDNKGISLAGVTVDIDDAARSAATPDIGADEFTTATMAVGEVASKIKIRVYPNPVNDILTVYSGKKVSHISVYSVGGQMIRQVNNTNVINLAKLSTGIYFVKTIVEGTTEMTKVIKK